MEIVSRAEAKSQGLKRFFTGDLCVRKHKCERVVSTNACVMCKAEDDAKYRANNLDILRKADQQKYLKNPEVVCARTKRWRQSNSDRRKTTDRARYAADPEPAKRASSKWYSNNSQIHAERTRKWRRANPSSGRTSAAKRRAAKLKRTPRWADLDAIKKIYLECPEGMTVDHEIPLQGEMVSGLHVHYNLQYLTPSENYSKGNRFTSFE